MTEFKFNNINVVPAFETSSNGQAASLRGVHLAYPSGTHHYVGYGQDGRIHAYNIDGGKKTELPFNYGTSSLQAARQVSSNMPFIAQQYRDTPALEGNAFTKFSQAVGQSLQMLQMRRQP